MNSKTTQVISKPGLSGSKLLSTLILFIILIVLSLIVSATSVFAQDSSVPPEIIEAFERAAIRIDNLDPRGLWQKREHAAWWSSGIAHVYTSDWGDSSDGGHYYGQNHVSLFYMDHEQSQTADEWLE